MKIAFVVQRYGLEVNGGAELLCRLIAERLTVYCQVEVITTCAIDYISWKNEYPPGEERINGVYIRRFTVDYERDITEFNKKSERIFGENIYSDEIEWMKMQGPYSSSLLEFLNTHHNEYDSIFFFTYLYCTTFFGIQNCKEKAILIPTAHDEPPIYLSIFKEIFSSPQYIIYSTPEERNFTHSLFKNATIPSQIVGIGIDKPDKLSPETFIKSYNLSNFILYTGRICQSKECPEMFEFFIRYKKEKPSNLKLVLIGKPVIPIPDNPDIIPLGFVSSEEKFNAMAAARLLIMPSKFESLSIVLLESWYCKRPVFVNGKCTVLVGQCKRSNGGLWYENYKEFEAGLSLLLKDEGLCIHLGKNGYQYVLENYDWEVIERKYFDAIDYIRYHKNQFENYINEINK